MPRHTHIHREFRHGNRCAMGTSFVSPSDNGSGRGFMSIGVHDSGTRPIVLSGFAGRRLRSSPLRCGPADAVLVRSARLARTVEHLPFDSGLVPCAQDVRSPRPHKHLKFDQVGVPQSPHRRSGGTATVYYRLLDVTIDRASSRSTTRQASHPSPSPIIADGCERRDRFDHRHWWNRAMAMLGHDSDNRYCVRQ